jgi:hypothetical protein
VLSLLGDFAYGGGSLNQQLVECAFVAFCRLIISIILHQKLDLPILYYVGFVFSDNTPWGEKGIVS